MHAEAKYYSFDKFDQLVEEVYIYKGHSREHDNGHAKEHDNGYSREHDNGLSREHGNGHSREHDKVLFIRSFFLYTNVNHMHYALNGENETTLWEMYYKTVFTVITDRRGLDFYLQ